MGNKTSSLNSGQDDLVFDTYTNSGTSFKVALWGAMREGKGGVEVGIADVWANMFIEADDAHIPIHVATLTYRNAYLGKGRTENALFSVLFELVDSKGRDNQGYLHLGGEAGMVYFDLGRGERYMDYGVVEQHSAASSAYLVTGIVEEVKRKNNAKAGGASSSSSFSSSSASLRPCRVYLLDEAISVPHPTTSTNKKKNKNDARNDDVNVAMTSSSSAADVADHLYMQYWEDQVPASVVKRIPGYLQADPSNAVDFPESVLDAMKAVEEETRRVQKN